MNQTRVLIVGDHEMFIEMAKFVLTAAGYQVEAATNAASALEKISIFLPDLNLMDIQIPVINGMELTRQLKSDSSTEQVVIVAFSAYSKRDDASKLQASGFDGVIAKPVDVMTLAAEVRFWLEATDSSGGKRFVWP